MRAEVLALVLPLLIALALMAIAALVAKTGWAQIHNRLFAALYFLSGAKSVSDAMLASDGARPWADAFHAGAPLFPAAGAWLDVQVVTALFMAPLLLLFVLHFPRQSPRLAGRAGRGRELALFAPTMLALAVYFLNPPWLLPFFVGVQVIVTGITVFAIVRLAKGRASAVDARERQQTGYVLAGFLPAFVVTWLLTLDDGVAFLGDGYVFPGAHDLLVSYISPVLELGAAALVAYAILKFRILAIELRVKGGVKYVIMSAVVGTVLFAVSTYVGNFVLQNQIFSFAGPEGSAALAGIGTILLFKPVEKFAERLTNKLFPETVDDPAAYARQRAREIYAAQCTYVLRDASVSDRELAFLVALRGQLGLALADAQAIEEEVEQSLGVDDARTGRAGRLRNLVAEAREGPAAPRTPAPGEEPEAGTPGEAGTAAPPVGKP